MLFQRTQPHFSNAEKRGLYWLKQRYFIIFRHILTKLGDKVHILLYEYFIV